MRDNTIFRAYYGGNSWSWVYLKGRYIKVDTHDLWKGNLVNQIMRINTNYIRRSY